MIKESAFPKEPIIALKRGFRAAEEAFLKQALNDNGTVKDKSGSCAIVVLIVGDMCYVANVGDSRAIMSGAQGKKLFPLSKDHKPNENSERTRIEAAGGKIY